MRRPDRFFCDRLASLAVGDRVVLDPREAGHASRVKRHGTGSEIELIDGFGRVARAVIEEVGRRGGLSVTIAALKRSPPPACKVQVVTAVPKGDRMETLLDMATQLGVYRVTPLVFERSVAHSGAGRQDRWRRILTESCKQSRRNYLPELDEPRSLQDWLESDNLKSSATRWLADPDGASVSESLSSTGENGAPRDIVVVIGPEGGVTDAERGLLHASGFQPVVLGAHILRIETAVIAFAAVLSARFGL